MNINDETNFRKLYFVAKKIQPLSIKSYLLIEFED